MGKNFCKVENKWCKYLKHCGLCAYCNTFVDNIGKCPRVTEIETTPFHVLLGRVDFDVVMSRMTKWFPGQEKNRDGYEKVFTTDKRGEIFIEGLRCGDYGDARGNGIQL